MNGVYVFVQVKRIQRAQKRFHRAFFRNGHGFACQPCSQCFGARLLILHRFRRTSGQLCQGSTLRRAFKPAGKKAGGITGKPLRVSRHALAIPDTGQIGRVIIQCARQFGNAERQHRQQAVEVGLERFGMNVFQIRAGCKRLSGRLFCQAAIAAGFRQQNETVHEPLQFRWIRRSFAGAQPADRSRRQAADFT